MSIADLLQAAEYIERRERGKNIFFFLIEIINNQTKQKQNMVMQRLCNTILINVDLNQKNHWEVGKSIVHI